MRPCRSTTTHLPALNCLHKIDRYSALAERAAGQAVSSANQLVGQVKQMQLVALDTAPAEVQSTEWFKQFKDGVKQMNSTSEASLLFSRKQHQLFSSSCSVNLVAIGFCSYRAA